MCVCGDDIEFLVSSSAAVATLISSLFYFFILHLIVGTRFFSYFFFFIHFAGERQHGNFAINSTTFRVQGRKIAFVTHNYMVYNAEYVCVKLRE